MGPGQYALQLLREFGLPTLFCVWFMHRDGRRHKDEVARWGRVETAAANDRQQTYLMQKEMLSPTMRCCPHCPATRAPTAPITSEE